MNQSISFKNIWKVSLPIIFSGVAQNIVNVTDTAFLGRVGMVELGAAGNSGIFYFVLLVLGIGFTIGCQIIIGRRNGEKNFREIGSLFNTALLFLLPLALFIFILVKLFSPLLLSELIASPDILTASNDYLKVRIWGIFFAFVNFLFIAFYTGITSTKVLTKATFLQAIVNVILDYLLIFGVAGFPKMGIAGAALASVISEIVAFLYFIYFTRKKVDREKYNLFVSLKFTSKKLPRIMKVAFPIMLQNFMALTSWLIFFMIIEQIGEKELAVSHIARSIYMVLMIPLFGFSSATSTLVSNVLGQGNQHLVLKLVERVVKLSLGCTLLFMPILFFFPTAVLSIYTDNSELINASYPVLNVICGSMLLFSIAYIVFSAVTGTGKTLISMSIEFTSIFIYLIGAYFIGVYFELPLSIVWCSEFIYFGLMGGISILYLKFGNWKNSMV